VVFFVKLLFLRLNKKLLVVFHNLFTGLLPMIYSKETMAQFHQHSTYSFYARRSQKHKKIDNLTVFLTLLGSVSIKAVRRTLMKLSPCRKTLSEGSKRKFVRKFWTKSVFFWTNRRWNYFFVIGSNCFSWEYLEASNQFIETCRCFGANVFDCLLQLTNLETRNNQWESKNLKLKDSHTMKIFNHYSLIIFPS